uniref:Excision repair cross-complementation group 6-like n=1 Tax=Salarias fasciatus TaxID=181472 RepID=A0A672GJ96_SALFA
MGLGKTVQVVSFLSGMYDGELVRHTLLVMPTSLLANWTREFSKWTPGMRVKDFHGASKAERTRKLEKVQRRGGVLLTTYNMLMNNWQQLASYRGREFMWDYLILDEAHKIKNSSTKTTKSAAAVPARNRVLLTGTPVQNNLREMWALFDFACQGTLLGTAKTFKTQYENPITRAREKDATPGERALGAQMSENLMAIIRPHFLRRTKSEVQEQSKTPSPQDPEDPPVPGGRTAPRLTRKKDLVVWTYLSEVQERIYRQFLSLDHIKELLLASRSPLAELSILKKLCDHPRLLSAKAAAQLGLQGGRQDGDPDRDPDAQSIAGVPDATLISESGKMVFLLALLDRLRAEGHRTLVFAHYRKVLDILERVLRRRGFGVLRLDGTVTQLAERERRIGLFQSGGRHSVFLLTTQVGGVGVTLTAADRVVIYDPSWNPATDAQAVDRAYRIGQTADVLIYRLITCGSVEEKIYRRQVFKDSLIRQNTGDNKNPFRYFSKQELRELFTLEDPRSSSTALQLQALHADPDPDLDRHVAALLAMGVFGVSRHDLLFSLDPDRDEDEAPEDGEERLYIRGRVQTARELVGAESERRKLLEDGVASGTEAAWLRLQADVHRYVSRSPRTRSQSRFWALPDGPSLLSSMEKRSRRPGSGPSDPSPLRLQLDSAGSGQEDSVVDLTEDRTAENRSASPDPEPDPEPANASLQDPEPDRQDPARRSAGPEPRSPGRPSPPLLDHRLSVLHTSRSVLGDDRSPAAAFRSYGSDFNLQLDDTWDRDGDGPGPEDSNVDWDGPGTGHQGPRLQLEDSVLSSDQDGPGPGPEDWDLGGPGSEAVQQDLLSRLQLDGSFDVSRTLSDQTRPERCGRSLHNDHTPNTDASVDGSVVAVRKRRAAVIYDSEEDEPEDPSLHGSPDLLHTSTPKFASGPESRGRSLGRRLSVAAGRWEEEEEEEEEVKVEQEKEEEEEEEDEGEEDEQEEEEEDEGEEDEDEGEEEEEDEQEEEEDEEEEEEDEEEEDEQEEEEDEEEEEEDEGEEEEDEQEEEEDEEEEEEEED